MKIKYLTISDLFLYFVYYFSLFTQLDDEGIQVTTTITGEERNWIKDFLIKNLEQNIGFEKDKEFEFCFSEREDQVLDTLSSHGKFWLNPELFKKVSEEMTEKYNEGVKKIKAAKEL